MNKVSLFIIMFVEIVFGAVAFDDNSNATYVSLEADFDLISPIERNYTSDVRLISLGTEEFENIYAFSHVHNAEHLLGTVKDKLCYYSNKNIEVALTYPGIEGFVITSIVILTLQGSNIGDIYIISGGIGEKHATVVIAAKQTYYLSYIAQIFGKIKTKNN